MLCIHLLYMSRSFLDEEEGDKHKKANVYSESKMAQKTQQERAQ
jgi:hypothetical protein